MYRLLAPLVLLGVSNANASSRPVQVILQPHFVQAPAQLHVRIVLEPHPDNRLLEYSVESEPYSLGSGRELAGETSPKVYDVWYSLPCGRYVVTARLSRLERTFETSERFEVLGDRCSG